MHVLDGSYQGFYLERSGTAGNPITFVADGPAVQITADNGTTPDGINLEGADARRHRRLHRQRPHARRHPRRCSRRSSPIRNCRTGHNGRWGIFTGFADDLLIENNETHHSQRRARHLRLQQRRPPDRSAATTCYDNHANGIHMNGDDRARAATGSSPTRWSRATSSTTTAWAAAPASTGRRHRQRRPQQPALRQPRQRHLPLPHRRRPPARRGNLVVNNTDRATRPTAAGASTSRDGSTGNTRPQQHPLQLPLLPRRDHDRQREPPGFRQRLQRVMSRFSIDGGNTVIDLAAWQALGYDAHSFVATPAELFLAPGSDFHLLPGRARRSTPGRATERAGRRPRRQPAAGRRRRRHRRLRAAAPRAAATAASIRASSAASPASSAPTRARSCAGCTCVAERAGLRRRARLRRRDVRGRRRLRRRAGLRRLPVREPARVHERHRDREAAR